MPIERMDGPENGGGSNTGIDTQHFPGATAPDVDDPSLSQRRQPGAPQFDTPRGLTPEEAIERDAAQGVANWQHTRNVIDRMRQRAEAAGLPPEQIDEMVRQYQQSTPTAMPPNADLIQALMGGGRRGREATAPSVETSRYVEQLTMLRDRAREILEQNPEELKKLGLIQGSGDNLLDVAIARVLDKRLQSAMLMSQDNQIQVDISLTAAEIQSHIAEASGREEYKTRQDEELRVLGYTRVHVPTQIGGSQEYAWPSDHKEKVLLMRKVLNDVEANYAQESTGTHQAVIQELNLVIPQFRGSDLGDKMFEELVRRSHFQSAFVAFATSSDKDNSIKAIAELYSAQMNLFFRDLRDYYDRDSSGAELAPGADLPILRAFKWYEENSDRLLSTPPVEVDTVHNELKEDLRAYLGGESGKYGGRLLVSDVDIDSAQRIAFRLWEMMRRYKKDKLVNKKTRIPYDRSTKEGREQLALDAKNNEVDFMGFARTGNRIARDALNEDYLWTRVANDDLKMEYINGLDFNNRDLMSMYPQDIEDYFTRVLTEIYSQYDDTYRNDAGAAANKASEEAAKLAFAITGVKKSINPNTGKAAWTSAFSSEPVEMSGLIFRLDELDELVQEGIITEQEREERRSILAPYVEPNEEIAEAEENAKIRNTPLAHIRKEFNGKAFDLDWLDPPSAKASRFFRTPANIIDMVRAKPDSYLRVPTPDGLLAVANEFYFLGASGRIPRSLLLMKNFNDQEFEINGPYANPERMEMLLANVAADLHIPEDKMEEWGEKMYKKSEYSPFWFFISYVPLHKMILAAVSELLEEMGKEVAKEIK